METKVLPLSRGQDGKFSSLILLTPEDLSHKTLRTGADHLLIPRTLPSSFGSIYQRGEGRVWRITAKRVRGAESFFLPDERVTVRTLLYTFFHRRRPEGRLRPSCGELNCINPLHQEESMSLPPDLCERYFQEALLRALAGDPFEITLKSEGDAIRYRAALNRWRKEKREENASIGVDYDALILRLRPVQATKPLGSYLLYAETSDDSFEVAFEQALTQGPAPKEVSAQELARELFGKNEEESE